MCLSGWCPGCVGEQDGNGDYRRCHQQYRLLCVSFPVGTAESVRHLLSPSPWSQTNWEQTVTPFQTIAPGSATPVPTKLSCVFVHTLSVFTYENSQLRSKVEVGVRTAGLQQHRTVVGNLEDKVKVQSGFSVRRTTEVRPVISAL